MYSLRASEHSRICVRSCVRAQRIGVRSCVRAQQIGVRSLRACVRAQRIGVRSLPASEHSRSASAPHPRAGLGWSVRGRSDYLHGASVNTLGAPDNLDTVLDGCGGQVADLAEQPGVDSQGLQNPDRQVALRCR